MNLESDPRQAGNSGGYFCDENWWLSLPKQTSSLWPDCSCHSDSKSQSTNCTGQTLSISVSLTPHFVVCLYPNPLFFHHILSLALLMTSLWLVFGPEVLVSYHLCWFYWSSLQNLEGPLFPPYRGDQGLKLCKLMKPATSGRPVRVACHLLSTSQNHILWGVVEVLGVVGREKKKLRRMSICLAHWVIVRGLDVRGGRQ